MGSLLQAPFQALNMQERRRGGLQSAGGVPRAGLHARRERALHLRPDRVGARVLLLRGARHVRARAQRRAVRGRGRAGRQPARRRALGARRDRVPSGAGAG